jgi:hypothetical protein
LPSYASEGAALQKAKRGDLTSKGPCYRRDGDTLQLDPTSSRSVVRLVSDQFDRLGSMHAVLRHLSLKAFAYQQHELIQTTGMRRPNQTAIKTS